MKNINQMSNDQQQAPSFELNDQPSSQEDIPEISHGRYRRGSDTEDEISGNNEDLLSLIRKGSSKQQIENALRNKGVNIDYQNKDEDTPLHVAVRKGHKDAVDLLINKGADVSIRNKKDKTALDLSKERLSKTPNDPNLRSIKTLLEQAQPSTSATTTIGTKRPWGGGMGGPVPKKGPNTSRTDPSLDPNPTYDASGVKRALHGTVYQSKLLMLFVKRAIDKKYDFRLATEMDAAEKFDDVVIKYQDQGKWTYRFLQAKHKLDPEHKKISVNDLMTETEGDFSLQKYFISFCKIKENPLFQGHDLKDFILATNTDFDSKLKAGKWKDLFIDEDLKGDDLLYFEGKGGKKLQIDHNGQGKKLLGEEIKSALLKKALEVARKSQVDLKNTEKVLELEEKKVGLATKLKAAENNLDRKKLLELAEEVLKLGNYRNLIAVKDRILQSKRSNDIDKKELIQEAENALRNLPSNKNQGLKEVKDVLGKIRNDLDDIKGNISKSTNIQNVKTEIGRTELKGRIPKKTLEEIQNNIITDLNEAKEILEKKFNQAISEIESEKIILEVALDDNKFKSEMNNFIEKFRFITNYPSEKELGGFIKHELGEEFHLLNADLVGDSFEREMLDFLKSYDKGKAKFYSWQDGENFFNALKGKIKTLMTSGISKAYPEKLRGYEVDFEKNIEGLRRFLSGNNQILHLETQGTELSAIKVLQTLESDGFRNNYNYLKKEDGYIFMRLRTLLRKETQDLVVKSFSSDQSHDLLVIECQAKTRGEANEIGQLHQKLSTRLSNSSKKIILIAENQDVLADKFKGSNQYSTLRDDEISFKDLSTNSQKKILEKDVNFQGKDLSLNQLIDKTSAVEIIDHASLSRLLQEEKVQIGNEKAFSSIGYEKDYYIERSLHRQRIKMQVLEDKTAHELFFITGPVHKRDLIPLGIEEQFIYSWAEGETYENGIILPASGQNDQEIFEKLSDRHSGKSIHWLEYQEGNLFWRDFTGSLSVVRGYIEDNIPDRKNALEEGHLSKSEKPKEKIVILANDPGEGKSTVLTSLANKMKEQDAASWIVRVDLNDYAEKGRENSLEKINFIESEVNKAIDFVSKMAVPERSEHSLERTLFTRVLERDAQGARSKIVIFFDGFDEISPTYKERTIGLLKALKKSHLAQLWVTTRFHEKPYLEGQLESTAYLLNPLTREEQGAFLDKFWSWHHKEKNVESLARGIHDMDIDESRPSSPMEVDQPESSLSAKNWLKEWIKSIGNKNRDFNLVPLNLKMLAEVVLKNESQLPEKLGLYELFKRFIKAKFGIYYQDKSRISQGNVGADDVIKRDLENLGRAHRELALKLFFPKEYEKKSLPGLDEQSRFKNEELARVGLLALKGALSHKVCKKKSGN